MTLVSNPFFSETLSSTGTRLRIRTALDVASFIITYFLGLTYAILRAGTGFGVVEYSAFLMLAAVVLGILAVKFKNRFGATFLIFFNVSRIFFLGIGTTYLLNAFGHSQSNLKQRELLRVLSTALRCLCNSKPHVRFRF